MATGDSGVVGLPQEYLNLSEEIVSTLAKNQVIVTDEFVLMIVRVVSLNPQYKFILKQLLEPTEIDRMKRVTVERILSMTPIARQILLMQLHYKKHSLTREELLQRDHGEMENQLKSILDELCAGSVPTQPKHRGIYYHKMILAIITKTGISIGKAWHLGKEYNVVQQTNAALSTIFPQDDIDLLNAFGPEDRNTEIRSLIHIALGIRILNKHKDPENAGAGLTDLKLQLPEMVKVALDLLGNLRNRSLTRLVYYTTIIKPLLLDPILIKRPGRRGITREMLQIRQGLTMIHQLLHYIRILDQELNDEERMAQSLTQAFDETLKDLSSPFGRRKSEPNFTNFPKFTELANTWLGIRDSLGFVTNCCELLKSIDDLSEECLQNIDAVVRDRSTDGIVFPTAAEFLNQTVQVSSPYVPVPRALARRSTFTGDDVIFIETQYSGFCVWSLVQGLGLTVFSNPSIGLFHWNERKYLVSTSEGAEHFVRNPDAYIHKVIHLALKWPELIILLRMEDDVFQPEIVGEAIRTTPGPKIFLYADAEIQSDVHPMPTNIVEGYSWNEWDYRRKALILSNVHKSVTHSTQTHVQSINTSESTQTYPLRNQRIQTTRSVYTEAPRNQFYFFGLRGHHCTALGPQPPHIVELTREPVLDLTKVKFPTKETLSLDALIPQAEPNLKMK